MKYPYIRVNIWSDSEFDITVVIFEHESVGSGRFITKNGGYLPRYSLIRNNPEARFKTLREAIGVMKKFFDVEEFTEQYKKEERLPNLTNKYYYVKGIKSKD